MSGENVPWPMIGTFVSVAILLIALLVNFVKPWRRRRHLQCPCNVYFNIRAMADGELGYALLDDRGHLLQELLLPPDRLVEVEISYYPHIHYKQEELVFGCEGSTSDKPLPIERFTRYISEGKNRWRPGEDESDYISRTGAYHVRRSAARNVGTCYTVGYIVKTQKVGTYKATVSFLTDEIEGNAFLSMKVQEKASGRLKCHVKEHDGCYVKPHFTQPTGTEISGRHVELRGGPRAVVTFTAGRAGPHEAGYWEFWVAVGGMNRVTARCRVGADPGERFRRSAPSDEAGLAFVTPTDYLQPAGRAEVERWLDEHADDAQHASVAQVGGKALRVVHDGGRFRLVE